MTKPLAGYGRARIVGTIGGTGGVSTADTHHTTADTHHTTADHELRTNDEPAELPARPTL